MFEIFEELCRKTGKKPSAVARDCGIDPSTISHWKKGLYTPKQDKLNHTPHDTRHTFATCAMLSGMDEYAVKLIMGHSVSDLTKRVYTHANEEWLKEQMGKYKIC